MKWLAEIFPTECNIRVTGLTKELNVLYILNTFKNEDGHLLVVTNSLYESNQLYSLLSTYTSDVLLFPMDDFLSSVALAISPDLKIKRLETLNKIQDKRYIVITNLMGYLKFLPAIKEGNKRELTLKVDEIIKREEILERLEHYGYTRDTLVSSTGTYAVRGFILDIFSTYPRN